MINAPLPVNRPDRCFVQRRRTLVALVALPGLIAGGLHAAPPASAPASASALKVGPNEGLKTPSAAARVAPNGAVVEIAAGDYHGDVAVWTQHGLTLRGVGGRARLHAAGQAAEGKAIWVIKGNHVTVEHIEFSGARVRSLNGAGIRAEGAGLTIRDSRFHDNENSILTNHNPDSILLIEDCEFSEPFVDFERTGRLGHNIYVGQIRRFTLLRSHVHGAEVGHQVKSRARQNDILSNRIVDGAGASSYLIDLPDGGTARIIGNTLQQSARAPNRTAIAFAAEGNRNAPFGTSLAVTGNRFTNEGTPGTFVRNHTDVPVQLKDNLLTGAVTPLVGPGTVE